jgi:hypothetical protein
VLILEAADDVTQGATKGNSGIVHAGFDDKPGTNRAKYCWPGNQMFPQLDRELRFGFQKTGSLVVARNDTDMALLDELLERGHKNGVQNLRIVKQEELLQIWNTQKCTVLMITHDIDEALFLADRLVMMTNGPAASIGEVMTIDFPRPRNREDIMEDPKYYELRNTALDFLYNRFAHDDDVD